MSFSYTEEQRDQLIKTVVEYARTHPPAFLLDIRRKKEAKKEYNKKYYQMKKDSAKRALDSGIKEAIRVSRANGLS